MVREIDRVICLSLGMPPGPGGKKKEDLKMVTSAIRAGEVAVGVFVGLIAAAGSKKIWGLIFKSKAETKVEEKKAA